LTGLGLEGGMVAVLQEPLDFGDFLEPDSTPPDLVTVSDGRRQLGSNQPEAAVGAVGAYALLGRRFSHRRTTVSTALTTPPRERIEAVPEAKRFRPPSCRGRVRGSW